MTNVIYGMENDVQEIVLLKGTYRMAIAAGVMEQIDSVNHNLNLIPFCDYKMSYDNGFSFFAPHYGQPGNGGTQVVNSFTDKTKVYFAYGVGVGTTPAFTLIIDYKLFITEVVK